jgi:hypothetical protein
MRKAMQKVLVPSYDDMENKHSVRYRFFPPFPYLSRA